MNRPLLFGVGAAAILCGVAVYFFAPGPFSGMFQTFSFSFNDAETATGESDFTPPTHGLANADPGRAGARQLLFATSTDGITFAPTGERFTAQGNVPDAVVTDDGTIFVYYIGQSISAKDENTVVATSTDDGKTWTYHFLQLENFPSPRDPSDPDVVLLSNGAFRMFYTDSLSATKTGIRYADSADGFTFTYGGVALEAPLSVADSTTFLADNTWTMIVIDHTEGFPFKQYRATSTDGKNFVYQGDLGPITGPEGDYFLSNPLPGDASLRFFGFPGSGKSIQSFTSEDAITWTAASQTSLSSNALALQGGTYLQDSTVAKLTNGTYLMIYVTDMPK